MQGVGVMAGDGTQPGPPQAFQQRGAPVDADVAAGDVVVLVRQRPVDGLGAEAGHGHGHGARRGAAPGTARPWPAPSSGMCSSTSEAMTRSKLPSAKGRRRASPWTTPGLVVGAHLAGVDHGAEGVADLGHLVGLGVEGDHPRPEAHGLEGVAAATAAEVEQPVAPAHAEAVVVDGQHGRPAPR